MSANGLNLQRDFVGYGAHPPDPKWPNGARLALNIVVNYEEGSEASFVDGDNETESGLTEGGSGGFEGRDLGAESMFEYGSRVGIWRVLGLLKERAMPATAFACSLALERNPEVARAIGENGMDVCSHGRRWVRAQRMTREEEALEIKRAYDSITSTVGHAPEGWYCRYAPSVNTRELLVEHGGFLYDSDAYNDELPYWMLVKGQPHLVVPYSLTNNDVKFARGSMATGNDFFSFIHDAVDMLCREGASQPKMMSIGLHARLIGHPGRAAGLERLLDELVRRDDVWICRRIDLANHWRHHHPYVE
ncbi:Peptidoglycan/xylan/chitin deacetylase, PgdA/CDA1 family [Burkholderia sp. D7]|nr:Peptidoglycan/xylan/chitin deacetylase, PgdA/CDA1 family [Burkholderia sp. D7]